MSQRPDVSVLVLCCRREQQQLLQQLNFEHEMYKQQIAQFHLLLPRIHSSDIHAAVVMTIMIQSKSNNVDPQITPKRNPLKTCYHGPGLCVVFTSGNKR